MLGFPFNNKGFLPALVGVAKAIGGSGLFKAASSAIGKVAGSTVGQGALSAIGTSVGGALGGKLSDKINGIPSALSATEQGNQAAEYMNAAYPGTTAWDRLGAGGGGASTATSATNVEKLKMKQESQLQSRALTTQAMISDRQNRSHLIATAAGLGPPAINEVLNAYDSRKMNQYDTPVAQSGKKLPSEIARNEAETQQKKYGAVTPLQNILEDTKKSFQNPNSNGNRLIKNIKDGYQGSFTQKIVNSGRDLFNRASKLPTRLKFSPVRKNK